MDESGRFLWTRKQKLAVNLDEIVGYGGRKKDKLPAEVGRDGWFWWTRTEKLGVKLDEKSCFLRMRKSNFR